MTTTTISASPMEIAPDVGIPMPDGGLLRANVWRPRNAGPLLVMGKDLAALALMPGSRTQLTLEHPEGHSTSSGRWTPFGCAVVRLDVRGTGRVDVSCHAMTAWRMAERCAELTAVAPWHDADAYREPDGADASTSWRPVHRQAWPAALAVPPDAGKWRPDGPDPIHTGPRARPYLLTPVVA